MNLRERVAKLIEMAQENIERADAMVETLKADKKKPAYARDFTNIPGRIAFATGEANGIRQGVECLDEIAHLLTLAAGEDAGHPRNLLSGPLPEVAPGPKLYLSVKLDGECHDCGDPAPIGLYQCPPCHERAREEAGLNC